MRFLLAFALIFVSVFASAQVPMVLGGPQGIDVTRILARNWMSIPIYIDTPAAPLTGSGWPGRGYIVHVAKANDTTVWHYTGTKWQKIGGVAENRLTVLVDGGKLTRNPTLNRFTVGSAIYYIQGQYYTSSITQLNGFPKTPNANGRIDIVALGTSGPLVIQGTESTSPVSPVVTSNRIKLGFVYYPPFDSLPTISGNGIEAIFRKPGVDSIFFSTSDTTLSIRDSIGIAAGDTATMLNPYKFTAANGLTKDSTVFRLGGSLNQNTNINLNSRRLTIIGGTDTTRFFSNGRVSIGGTPDSTNVFNVNGNTRVNGILRLAPSSPSNAAVIINQNSSDGSLVWAGNALSLPSNLGARNVIINPTAIFSNLTGFENVLIGRGTGNNLISGNGNTFVGNNTGTSITSSFNTMIGSSDGWGNLPSNTSRSIQLIAGGHESNRADTALLGLTTQYAFIGGGSFGNGYVRDYYFGGGNRVRSPHLSNINFFAPSGYPTAIDTIGSDFTINAGRGTGQGRGGSVIFRTSDTTTAGTTLQTLTERVRITPAGNLLVGTSTDSIFRLDVNGTSRFSSSSYFSNGRIFYGPSSSDTALVMKNTQSNTASPGISIGNNSTPVFARSAIFGDRNIITGQVPYTGGYLNNIVGNNNTVDSSGNIIVIGNDNSVPNPTSHQIVLGYNNVSNSSTNSQNASIVIGLGNNTNSFRGGGLIGSGLKYYANSQLAFGGNSNNVDFSIKNVYFGNGVKNEHNNINANFGHGPDVAINPSWANDADSINRRGGSLTLAGGRGTGTGTPGSVIFSTWKDTTSGTLFHPSLIERVRISHRGNLLVGTATDDTSSLVNIVSTTKGFLQPRMTNTQRDSIATPATGLQLFSTTDSANYVYRGAGGGWQKMANEISGSATLDFPSTGHGTSSDLTFTVTGAAVGDVVSLGIPNDAMVANISYTAWVSATDTVTVRLDHYASSGSVDPVQATFKVKVFK